MRTFTAVLNANNEILPGVHILEVQAAQLARAAQPGQYCLLRGCDELARDPLLRRPFFVAGSSLERDVCRFVVYQRGRSSSWLTRQQAGMTVDLLGPLGHGWTIRPETRNLLLVGEDPFLPALLALADRAIEQEIAVTLVHCVADITRAYPAALLSPEIEYQIFRYEGKKESLAVQISEYLNWADSVCCSVSANLLTDMMQIGRRWQEKHFAQASLERSLTCVVGTCLGCQIETRAGPRLVCRDGPIFSVRDLVGDW